MEIGLEYDADEGYQLVLTGDDGNQIVCPPHEGVSKKAIYSAERLVEAATKIKDRVWQDYEADEVEDAEMAMMARQNWQEATSHLLDLFQLPGEETP